MILSKIEHLTLFKITGVQSASSLAFFVRSYTAISFLVFLCCSTILGGYVSFDFDFIWLVMNCL